MDIATVTIAGVGAVPLVLALVQVLKSNFPALSDYAQFVSIFIAEALVIAAQGFSLESIVTGLVIGLAASGLWSSTKSTITG